MDWTDIKALSESGATEIVKEYLIKHGFTSSKIDTKMLPSVKKAPDLKVLKDGRLVFYCEVKTPEHNLNPETKMYHWDITFYKL